MSALSRRRFLKISGAAVGAAAAGTAALRAAGTLPSTGLSAEKGIRTVPTFCDICFWKCGAIATVRDGALWKIEGNPLDRSATDDCVPGAPAVSARIMILIASGRRSSASAAAVRKNGWR